MTKRTNHDDPRGLRTVRQAMERLGCGRSKILALAREGRLEMVKLDHRHRITERSLQRFEDELLKS